MPKEKATSTSINLWEQWLQRLNVAPIPVFQLGHQIELLELVSRSPVTTDQFFCRLGTTLIHSLPIEAVYMYEPGPSPVTIFTNALRREQGQFKNYLRIKGNLRGEYEQHKIVFHAQVARQNKRFSYYYEYLLKRPDKPNLMIALFSRQILSPDDLQLTTIIRNVIALRLQLQQTSNQYLIERDRFTTLSHRLSEGLVVIDQNQIIKLWNRPMQNIVGYPPKEAIGQTLSKLVTNAENPDWLINLQKEYEEQPNRNVFTSEFEVKTRPGQVKWLRISGSFLRDKHGKTEQAVILVHDRSKDHLLEQQKNDFISIATHELRTPITAIRGYLSFMQKDNDNFNERQHRHLERAMMACERLVDLSEELLEVTRLEQNRLVFSLKRVTLEPMCRKVVSDFQGKAKSKKLKLEFIKPEFPTDIMADQTRVEQVIANLLDNALKYTLEGHVTLGFRQENKDNIPYLVVAISDTGIGMTASESRTVFEKFQRTQAAQQTGESGTGLGLYIAKTFVERMGGQITVRSRPRRGTTFSVIFPQVENRKENNE